MTNNTLPEGFIKNPNLHAYLAVSSDGKTRRDVCRSMAMSLLCSAPDENMTPCGTCSNCIKSKDAKHPDLFFISGLQGVKVDDIRRMEDEAYLASNEADCKVFVLEDADLFNVQSQNALLKIIEEPPKGVKFIFSASSVLSLLPTVRSRVCMLGIGARSYEALYSELKKEFPDMSPSRLNRLCAFMNTYSKTESTDNIGEAVENYCNLALEFLSGKNNSPILLFPKKREDIMLCLQVFMLAIRDIASARCGISDYTFLSREEIVACSAKTSLKRAVSLYDVFEEGYNLTEGYANTNAALAYLSQNIR